VRAGSAYRGADDAQGATGRISPPTEAFAASVIAGSGRGDQSVQGSAHRLPKPVSAAAQAVTQFVV